MAIKNKKAYYGEIAGLAALALAIFFILKFTKHDTTKYYNAYFSDIKGLQPSSAVHINGVRVGKISDIELHEKENVKIILAVNEDILLPEGTVASLASGGLNGERLILLERGKSSRMLPENATLLTNLDSSMMPMSVRIEPMIKTAKMILNSADVGLQGLSFIIDAGLARTTASALIAIDRQTYKLKNVTTKMNQNPNLESSIENAYRSTADMAANTKETSESIRDMKESMKDAANAPIANNIKKLRDNIASLKNSVTKINVDTGALGRLIKSPRTYNQSSNQLDTLNKNLTEVYNDPPVFSIFGGSK